MKKTTQFVNIIKIMKNDPDGLWRSWNIGKAYSQLFGVHIQYGTRLCDLTRGGYVETIHFTKKKGSDLEGTYYTLTELGKRDGVIPLIPNYYSKKKIRSIVAESEIKSENKVLNEYIPPIQPTTLLGKIRQWLHF